MDSNATLALPLLSPAETASEPLEGQVGKDEINLAEFPFAVLSKRVAAGQKTIVVQQEGRDAQGRPVQQEWLVTGSDRFGLPLASDDEVYVALMKLLRDSHFASRTVRFTVAQLLRIMHSGVGKRDYDRVEQSLDRLTGVLLRSKNAFWSHASKRHVTEAFHLLDSYRLARGGNGRELSEVTFSAFLFSSIQAGYVKNLDIDFYFALSGPLARRYYRLLDKHRYRGQVYEIELQRLAQKLPLQDAYASQLRRRLDPVHAEFIARGFLEAAEYRPSAGGSTVVRLQFAPRAHTLPASPASGEALVSPVAAPPHEAKDAPASHPAEEDLEARLRAAGVARKVAADLVRAYASEEIARQLAFLPYVPQLKNPGGYLRQAIEQGYAPPPGWTAAQQKAAPAPGRPARSARPPRPAPPAPSDSEGPAPSPLEAARRQAQADPVLWEQVLAEAQARMPKIIRDRPQHPTYAPTFQTCLDAVVAERAAQTGRPGEEGTLE